MHAEEARSAKFNRAAYVTIRSADDLKRWIARAFDVGQVALTVETSTADPMTAEITGISLATGVNDPAISRSRIPSPATAPGCSRADRHPTRSRPPMHWRRSSRCSPMQAF
jgi:DNA polymerase-1